MPDDTRPRPLDLPELYVSLLWNLKASAAIMLIKLPALAAAASAPQLATLLRDCIGMTSHHHDALERILARFDRAAPGHAAELETLLGSAARQIADWSPGDVRDVALSSIVRCAIYMAIPACELAIDLARVLGYTAHINELTQMRSDMAAVDSRLQLMIRARLATHSAALQEPQPSLRSL
jgi:ferritin-like metal-binding protein YciE